VTWTTPYSDDRDTAAAEPLNKNDAFEEDQEDEKNNYFRRIHTLRKIQPYIDYIAMMITRHTYIILYYFT